MYESGEHRELGASTLLESLGKVRFEPSGDVSDWRTMILGTLLEAGKEAARAWSERAARPAETPQGTERTAEELHELRERVLERNAQERLSVEQYKAEATWQAFERIPTLQPEGWAHATREQRAEALVHAAGDAERVWSVPLGGVTFERMPAQGLCEHTSEGAVITLHSSLLELDHPKEAVKTLVHEFEHAYQWAYVEGARQAGQDALRQGWDVTTAATWARADAEYSDRWHRYANNALEHGANLRAAAAVERLYLRSVPS
ncbi:hypothetical protein [Deinococcus yavapaiensis]|uniref:SprT-like family protein n=1 Tax=Deinococcus yavapaiensis KR-236 TaxID=694435 RepID=A0A318S4K9_9DEIO|nr:hypothetical protein [Deinococcus yavapaiensis]PYE51998.1 hypothetical protein DES52_11344 [Deinococcus yavapaiensis KR-236]